MAEALIRKTDNWMSGLDAIGLSIYSDGRYDSPNSKFMDRYNARYKAGDVIRIAPDGYWTKKVGDVYRKVPKHHVVIKFPGTPEDYKYFEEQEIDEADEFKKVLKERKHRLGIEILAGVSVRVGTPNADLSLVTSLTDVISSTPFDTPIYLTLPDDSIFEEKEPIIIDTKTIK